MQAIHADNVNWKSRSRGVREAKIYSAHHGTDETRIDMVEVPAGGYIPPHRHSSRREFITILLSAGAQLQIGDRIFRPIAGQVFHREPEEILALTNDSHHPFRYSVVRFGYEPSDIEWLNEADGVEAEDQLAAHAATISPKEESQEIEAEKPVVEEPVAEEEPQESSQADQADEVKEAKSSEATVEDASEESEKAEKPAKTPKKTKTSKASKTPKTSTSEKKKKKKKSP
jgi:quercetin dioxygenase-like cupin family protein